MERARKHSKKREALLGAIKCTKDHPSAEMLYARLKGEYPDLSLGTVYRNLSLFVQNGDAMSVGTVAGQERYDGNTEPHAHFVCEGCGRVLDVDSPGLTDELYKRVEDATGGKVRTHFLTFTGLCRECEEVKTA